MAMPRVRFLMSTVLSKFPLKFDFTLHTRFCCRSRDRSLCSARMSATVRADPPAPRVARRLTAPPAVRDDIGGSRPLYDEPAALPFRSEKSVEPLVRTPAPPLLRANELFCINPAPDAACPGMGKFALVRNAPATSPPNLSATPST